MFFTLPLFAQSVDTAWVRTYNGPENQSEFANAIVVDKSGNIYVTGNSEGDYVTLKYHPSGTIAWVRRYDGPTSYIDAPKAITVDNSGNICVTGLSWGNGTGYDYATIKYYPSGDTAWVRRYNGPPGDRDDEAQAIAADDAGNIYVTGRSDGSSTLWDYATIKYHPNGDTAWVRRYNGPPGDRDDEAQAIAVDKAGNVYVTGWGAGNGTDYDYVTIKYYANGDTAWVRRYNGPTNHADYCNAIALDGSGNVYVTGSSYNDGTFWDCATIKYFSNGDTAWVRRYSASDNSEDYSVALVVDNSGNIYLTGISGDYFGNYIDYLTIKYLPDGDTAWVRRYNGPGNGDDYAYGIAIDDSNNAYVTGRSEGCLTIKYFPNGDTAWVRRYKGRDNYLNAAYAIALDGSDVVYVIGESFQGSETYSDYLTIKYSCKHPPIIDQIEAKYVVEGNELTFSVHVIDTDRDSIALHTTNMPANALFTDSCNGTGIFSFHPSYTQAGSYTVEFIATDPSGLADSELVCITVIEAGNQRPKLAPLKDAVAAINQVLSIRISATDPDGTIPHLFADSLPNNSFFHDSLNGKGIFTFTPDNSQYDSIYRVTFIASDDSLSDSAVMKITVIEYFTGDANGDGKVTVSDVIYLINYLFKGGPTPNPLLAGDANHDDKVTVADVIYLINYLFKGGPSPIF